MSYSTLLDSDLLWLAMRSKSDNLTQPTSKSRQIEAECQHAMPRYWMPLPTPPKGEDHG